MSNVIKLEKRVNNTCTITGSYISFNPEDIKECVFVICATTDEKPPREIKAVWATENTKASDLLPLIAQRLGSVNINSTSQLIGLTAVFFMVDEEGWAKAIGIEVAE